jgi:glycosyltransferase involved in cell wall biosynthesis
LQPLSNLLAAAAGALAGIRLRVGTHHLPYNQFNPVLMKLDGAAGRVGLYSDLVACGQSVADTYRHNGETYMRRLTVIPNGHAKPVPADRSTARAAFGLPPKGAALGQLGRLYHQKNQRFSIGLLADLPDTSLLMIGSGPDEDLVRSEIASRGYADHVHLHLHVEHSRIGEFYSAIDAVLFPSSFEGLSLAAIEAIHAGVPLICSDIPSFREMFRDSPFLMKHLIVPLGDRDAWLTRIRVVLDDQSLRAQIAAELRQLSPRYAFETMSTKYLGLLD